MGAAQLTAEAAPSGIVGVLCVGMLIAAAGCRGRAQEDLYRQTLQREVRQLEDQLYEADYENRILIDKLRHERLPNAGDEDYGPSGSGQVIDPRDYDPSYVPADSSDFDRDGSTSPRSNSKSNKLPSSTQERAGSEKSRPSSQRESIPAGPKSSDPKRPSIPAPKPTAKGVDSDLDLPDMDSLVEPGELVDPSDLIDPGTLVDPGTLQRPIPIPRDGSSTPGKGSAGSSGKNNSSTPGFQLLPPPGGPFPPSTPDLEIEPIDPGIPMPPGSMDGQPDDEPGKIQLPGVSMLGGLGPVAGSTPKIELQPSKIRIDATTSKVRMTVEEEAKLRNAAPGEKLAEGTPVVVTEGVDLTIRADDQYGHPIAVLGRTHDPIDPLRSQETALPRPLPKNNARLTIIALDPTRQGDDAQLGRWNFDTEKLRQLETSSLSNQASGYAITVPIRWQERVPVGEAVVFFARFESDKRDLRCESEIGLKKQPSVAGWLPRR